MYGSGWGTRYDPAKFGVLDEPEEPPDLVQIRIDRPSLKRESPPYTMDQATQELQSLLAIRRFLSLKPGVNFDPVTATFDGAFGPSTAQAVMDYQVSKGLTPDGLVGSATWTMLLDYN